MDNHSRAAGTPITRSHAALLLAATIFTTLLIIMGGVVCMTESGAACPDWPGCFGRIVPPPRIGAIIEYSHRLIAALTTPLIVAAAWLSWKRARTVRWVTRPAAIAIVFTLAVIVFGAFAVLTGLPRGVAALDLGSALVVLALMATATTVAFARRADPALPDRLTSATPFARLSLWTLGAVYAVYVGGILVAGRGSLTRCLGWPVWRVIPTDLAGWPQIARLALAALAALSVAAVVIQAWRTKPGNRAIAVGGDGRRRFVGGGNGGRTDHARRRRKRLLAGGLCRGGCPALGIARRARGACRFSCIMRP